MPPTSVAIASASMAVSSDDEAVDVCSVVGWDMSGELFKRGITSGVQNGRAGRT